MHTPETRARELAKRKQRREQWLQENGPCPCGATENLEVDHIDPSEKTTHRVWSWSDERRRAELAKCQVLCAACHKEKTRQYHLDNAKHGTSTMYRNWGCRCEPCRKKKSEDMARHRLTRT